MVSGIPELCNPAFAREIPDSGEPGSAIANISPGGHDPRAHVFAHERVDKDVGCRVKPGQGPEKNRKAPRYSAAARFGVTSIGSPGWPVSRSPSSHIAKACFFTAGRTAAIRSVSRAAATPG